MTDQNFSRRSKNTDREEEAEPISRTKAREEREEQKQSLEQEKITHLKRKLNYIIAALIVMLLFVLLFMRFINF